MDVTTCIDVFAPAILLRGARCDFSRWRQCCILRSTSWSLIGFRVIAVINSTVYSFNFGIRPIGSSASSVNGIVTIKVPCRSAPRRMEGNPLSEQWFGLLGMFVGRTGVLLAIISSVPHLHQHQKPASPLIVTSTARKVAFLFAPMTLPAFRHLEAFCELFA